MKNPNPKTKSNTQQQQQDLHQEATNPGDFSFHVIKVAVSQILKSVGFKRTQVSALGTLTLVATKYLETLAESAVSFSNTANRTQSNLPDITNALHDMSLPVGFPGASTLHHNDSKCLLKSALLEDLSSFVRSTDEIPFAKPIKIAKERKREEEEEEEEEEEVIKASSSGNLQQQRGGHIPEWLPGFPDVIVCNKNCTNKRVNGETLWENSSLVLGCQSDGLDQEKIKGSNGGKLAKKRTRVKFRINNGGGGRGGKMQVHLNGYTGNNVFSESKDEEAEAEVGSKRALKSKENQTLTNKRKKR